MCYTEIVNISLVNFTLHTGACGTVAFSNHQFSVIFLKRLYLFILERGEGKAKERERNIDWLPFAHTPIGNLARNPGMCHDWELNRQPLALGDNAQPTEPRRPGQSYIFFFNGWKARSPVGGARGNHTLMFHCPSFSLPSPVSKNK